MYRFENKIILIINGKHGKKKKKKNSFYEAKEDEAENLEALTFGCQVVTLLQRWWSTWLTS